MKGLDYATLYLFEKNGKAFNVISSDSDIDAMDKIISTLN